MYDLQLALEIHYHVPSIIIFSGLLFDLKLAVRIYDIGLQILYYFMGCCFFFVVYPQKE